MSEGSLLDNVMARISEMGPGIHTRIDRHAVADDYRRVLVSEPKYQHDGAWQNMLNEAWYRWRHP